MAAGNNDCSSGGSSCEVGWGEMARVLGEAIADRVRPLTVGVFGVPGSGKSAMLSAIRDRMCELTASDETSLKVNVFALVRRLLFFDPVLGSTPAQRDPVRFIFVDVDLVDYAGADKVWAGVITRISTEVDRAFGKLSVRLFRVWHYKPSPHLDQFIRDTPPDGDVTGRWQRPPCSAFLVPVLVVLLLALTAALWVVYGLPFLSKSSSSQAVGSQAELSTVDNVTIAVTASLGLGILVKLTDIFKMIFNLARSQVRQVLALASRHGFEQSLGFMAQIRTEIRYLTAVTSYMSLVLRMRVRVCLLIDDVSALGCDRIFKLLEVVSMLQKTGNSPFVQILGMDSTLAANLLEKQLRRELVTWVDGYAYLKRFIELPFNIPPADSDWMRTYVTSSADEERSRDSLSGDVINKRDVTGVQVERDESLPLVRVRTGSEKKRPKGGHKRVTFACAARRIRQLLAADDVMLRFVAGSERFVARVVTTAQLTTHLFEHATSRKATPHEVGLICQWVILVERWPYRTSWIIQVSEDNLQQSALGCGDAREWQDDTKLEDVFAQALPKLNLPKNWEVEISADGDPEMFARFLQTYPLTLRDMRQLLPHTINLDRSITQTLSNCLAKDAIERASVRHKLTLIKEAVV